MPRDCKAIVMSNKDAKEAFGKMTKKLEASRKKTLESMKNAIAKKEQKINNDYNKLKQKVFLKVCKEAKKEEQVKLMKEFKEIQTDFNKQLKNSAISIQFEATHLGLSRPLK